MTSTVPSPSAPSLDALSLRELQFAAAACNVHVPGDARKREDILAAFAARPAGSVSAMRAVRLYREWEFDGYACRVERHPHGFRAVARCPLSGAEFRQTGGLKRGWWYFNAVEAAAVMMVLIRRAGGSNAALARLVQADGSPDWHDARKAHADDLKAVMDGHPAGLAA